MHFLEREPVQKVLFCEDGTLRREEGRHVPMQVGTVELALCC